MRDNKFAIPALILGGSFFIGARVGVLQITPVHSVNVSDYGINDLSSIEKKITGVVNATFRIH